MDFAVLLDAPGDAASTLQIAKLGSFSDARYGDFEITASDVEKWRENLNVLPGGKALIDLDHLSDKPSPHRRTEAAGWITGIDLKDGVPTAEVEWTPVGESAIKEKRYQFFSPAFGDFSNDEGTHHDVLTGGALTNKPYLSMATVQLASDDRLQRALADDPAAWFYKLALDGELGEDLKTLASTDQAMRDKAVKEGNALPDGSYPIPDVAHLKAAAVLAASGHGKAAAAKKLIIRRAKELGVDVTTLPGFGEKKTTADSQPAMPLSADILKLLGITDEAEQKKILDLAAEENADEAKVLEAIEAAKPKPEPTPTKTLEQQASAEGKVVLDQAKVAELTSQAAEGAQAKKALDTQTFTHAFDTASKEGRAVPADLEFYESLPLDVAVKRLEEAPKIVNTEPSKWDNSVTPVEETSPAQRLAATANKIMLDSDGKLDFLGALAKAELETGIRQDTIDGDVSNQKVMVR